MNVTNIPELSVSELSAALKRAVEDRFGLVRVRGEISGWKRAASGHAYLALKDESAVLDGVIWKGQADRLRFRPEDGLEVVCTGKLTTYPGRSKYQIIIESMEPAGAGALMALLEERKRKLAAEGLFDQARKKPLPYLPEVIGVVTSPGGAVIRDILHRLADRFPRHVLLWPVLVQGEGAAAQVAAAIEGFNAMAPGGPFPRPDLIIVARGGGSLEDLWAFNEEIVVRAAAGSAIPLISAVGHETDTTLIDFASDHRAPTPTAAAERAVPVRADLMAETADLSARLLRGLSRGQERRREKLRDLARALPTPRAMLGLAQQRFDELAERLPRALRQAAAAARAGLDRVAGRLQPQALARLAKGEAERLARQSDALARAQARLLADQTRRLALAARMLETLSYRQTLARGFAVVRDFGGKPVSRSVSARGRLTLEFADGTVEAIAGAGAGKPAKPDAPRQERLL